jgi:hypothetical protein
MEGDRTWSPAEQRQPAIPTPNEQFLGGYKLRQGGAIDSVREDGLEVILDRTPMASVCCVRLRERQAFGRGSIPAIWRIESPESLLPQLLHSDRSLRLTRVPARRRVDNKRPTLTERTKNALVARASVLEHDLVAVHERLLGGFTRPEPDQA